MFYLLIISFYTHEKTPLIWWNLCLLNYLAQKMCFWGLIKFLFLSVDLAHFRPLILLHRRLMAFQLAPINNLFSKNLRLYSSFSAFLLTLEMLSKILSIFEAPDGVISMANSLFSVIHYRQIPLWKNICFYYKILILFSKMKS